MEQRVILVDKKDNEIGLEKKMAAHKKGILHRAISVFVFNSKGEVMLQQRANTKYHSKGLWSNTCCSHPFEGEDVVKAGKRRLSEEMGFRCGLDEQFSFIYKAKVGSGLTEHEFDHVLFGKYNGKPKLNPEEVQNWKWVSMGSLQSDMKKNPSNYTAWMKILMKGKLRSCAQKFIRQSG